MKFAVLAGTRIEPTPKSRATCPFCEQAVVAKCGKVRIWHWAHKSIQHCDHWWEPETEWHREWKDQFPADWQEVGRRDENSELHIADVLTPTGLALEFQHSAIDRGEVEIRTNFHKKICWIIDGTRLQKSMDQFREALKFGHRRRSTGAAVYELNLDNSRLLKKWSGLSAPIVFDFGTEFVWVIGKSLSRSALVYPFDKEKLIQQLTLGNCPPPVQINQPQSAKRFNAGRRRSRF